MRKKRVELEQAVIVAARDYVEADRAITADEAFDPKIMAVAEAALKELSNAVEALDNYEAAELTGAGARYAAGSDTSRAAAGLSVPVQFSTRQQIIKQLAHLGELGLTDDQMENRLSRPHQTVSSARHWLVEAGWVRDSGHRRKTRSGREAVVWVLTDTGIKQQRKGNA